MRIQFFSAGSIFALILVFTIYFYANKVVINKQEEKLDLFSCKEY